jgi:hypothetical protein
MLRSTIPFVATASAIVIFVTVASAEETKRWEVPLGGNSFITGGPSRTAAEISRDGLIRWRDEKTVASIYFRVDRAAQLDLALRLSVSEGDSAIRIHAGELKMEKELVAGEMREVALGTLSTKGPGYVKVDLQGLRKSGGEFAHVRDLIVSSATESAELAYVREPGDNRFYWGRRGPSVHLGYTLPQGATIEYFHSEITVPEGHDPIGSYFMANGFGEGYFGMQVNGPNDRRVLFSVWSPFSTDNPRDIPEDQRVIVVGKGAGVRTGEFGNEGSGGQSFFDFPWKAGTTYGFLTRARPDGEGNTIYSAWFFAPEAGTWQPIASFKRPKTEKHLTGLHSFLENFSDRNGYLGRMAFHGNQWARDTQGEWHELVAARFTGDDTARRGSRLDYAGGSEGDRFFMRNGGFFDNPVTLDRRFERTSGPALRPDLDLDALNALFE